ncbi:MAG: 8-amino-7-oxononanoate synthase [Xanthobacteraceae bacterium]|uniref:8-amino-7-oxononanoate synthase n=1 Tax=Pseudolabrys sp. TaxID=1960880 RepID=UPI003D0CF9C9
MRSLDDFAKSKLAALKSRNLLRGLTETRREDGVWIEREGRRLLSFCCNDYLNLSHHPRVKAAAVAAIEQYGTGSGASRLITGNHPLLGELETRLARLKGTEAACVFGSGYLANSGIIPALVGAEGLVLVDELAHACIWAGAQLSRGRVVTFRHNDLDHVAELLAAHRDAHDRALIVTDGIFSMDGDMAPVAELGAVAQRHDAWLMTDDAHGLGIVGGGRGSTVETKADVPLQMGTLSKAIGGYGGYLCASKPVIELMHNRARTLIYSTGLPPAVVAAAIAALDVIETEPAYAALPLAKARAFTRMTNLPDAESPIVPVVIGAEDDTLAASRLLADNGFFVAAIRPPTVPPGTARLRLTFTAQHADADIERLAGLVRSHFLAH